MKTEQGFSLVEMLIAMGITLVLLAGAMGFLKDGLGLQRKAVLMGDVEQNLRAGIKKIEVAPPKSTGLEFPKLSPVSGIPPNCIN